MTFCLKIVSSTVAPHRIVYESVAAQQFVGQSYSVCGRAVELGEAELARRGSIELFNKSREAAGGLGHPPWSGMGAASATKP